MEIQYFPQILSAMKHRGFWNQLSKKRKIYLIVILLCLTTDAQQVWKPKSGKLESYVNNWENLKMMRRDADNF
jgi:hypothetical protein